MQAYIALATLRNYKFFIVSREVLSSRFLSHTDSADFRRSIHRYRSYVPPVRKHSASRQARAKRLAICEFCVVCVRPREHSAKPTHASATMRVLCKFLWSLCETQIIRLKHIHRICILRFSRDLCLLQVRNGEEGESLKEHYPHRPKCFSSNSHS